MNKNGVVWAKIPRAGLGNKLLLYAQALVYAQISGRKLIATNLLSFHIGPYLRGEKSKRLYLGYFRKTPFTERVYVRILGLFSDKVINPSFSESPESSIEASKLVVFQGFMFWLHFFDAIRDHRKRIIQHFYSDLFKKEIIARMNKQDKPEVSIHIRMGDFKESLEKKEFDPMKDWCVRIPLQYYIDSIYRLKEILGSEIQITVFSDGTDEELSELLNIEKVVRADENNLDIVDLLLMSKSKIIIPSPTSTFSLLSAFLSEAIILHHPEFFVRPIRPREINGKFYEGSISEEDDWVDSARKYLNLQVSHR